MNDFINVTIDKMLSLNVHREEGILAENIYKRLEDLPLIDRYNAYQLLDNQWVQVYAGKMHPLRKIIEEIREIFFNLGFVEENGNVVDSAFWNFDSLFQPQDHAAREMQDTFYLKNPLTCDLPDSKFVEAVRGVHEDGALYLIGSTYFYVVFGRKFALKLLLKVTFLRLVSTVPVR